MDTPLTPTLEKRVREHESRFSPLEETKSIMQDAKAALEASIAQLRQEKEGLDQEKATLAAQIAALTEERQTMQRQVDEIRAERDLLAAEDEAFAEEHLRHDTALKDKIKELKEIAEEIKRIAIAQ